jgi:hemoglobin-like flavoprotein
MADPDALAAAFYARLFALDPTIKTLFQGDMVAQGRKFTQMLTSILECIDRLDQVVPAVWLMGKRHGGYGVEHRHYETAREALIWALDRCTEGGLPPDTTVAWALLYNFLVATMEQAAAEGVILRQ